MITHKVEIVSFGLAIQVIVCLISSADGANIKLYTDKDYSALHLDINLTDTCYNVPSNNIKGVYSIITDNCVIAYNRPNCKAAWSSKHMPGKMFATDSSLGYYGHIYSLHKCNDDEGGPRLNVDITSWFENKSPTEIPNVLDSYFDVCTCLNVPNYVKDMSKWSINNHGNGLFAYFEPNCTEQKSKALYINAGHWKNSRDMHSHTRTYGGTTLKIQSLGPASNCTYFQQSCSANLNDKIMKLELLETLNSSSSQFSTDLSEIPIDLTPFENDDLINFFADENYLGFYFGSRSTSKCNNFSKPVQRRWVNGVSSIRTKTCVILYSDYDCLGRSIKIEAPGSSNLKKRWESTVTGEQTLSLLYTEYPNWKWETKSYHICNRDEGGSSLNVDITSNDPVDGYIILESYNNLCSCRKVPSYVQQLEKWSVNNHGNAMIAYFSPDCSSSTYSSLWIPAGQSSYSFGLGLFKDVNQSTEIVTKIQSIGPDPNSEYFKNHCNKSCIELSAIVSENTTAINPYHVCGFETKPESTQVSLFTIQKLVSELQHISNKVDALGQSNQLNFENTKSDFHDKLEMLKDEIKHLPLEINARI